MRRRRRLLGRADFCAGASMIAIEVDAVFDGEHFLSDGAVVIVEGRQIRSVNPRGTELPAGCELLQFPGTTLLPGLIDMHVHLCCDSGPDALDRIPEFSDAELVTVIETRSPRT